MTVSSVDRNKIKITLTDTEVKACFGTYEMLYTMSEKIKAELNALLREVLKGHKQFYHSKKVVAEIKVKKSYGCEITLTAFLSSRKTPCEECVFEFSDTESLCLASIMLYSQRKSKKHKSSLYKMPDCYHLIINCRNCYEEYFGLNEFCKKVLLTPFAAEYTREHGTPLIKDNAVALLGKTFSKGI